ncbi:motility associated factor glycosyltransferase family protein [Rheinheimera sp. UJ63]|uniref:motility associated factor glycosyltransferase family protein n=1 Tax=Rheinheimera sp. UJ63 TaxID=2910157 RepID=UPI001F2190B1|nr:6-hydroxymethylpterin diphosphokinase MptE-like protein [Rheinheimera sp. UJ63]MCF4009081.1 DUF115 domain-containing protein [Rheinheimera sp. UJ63]
MLNLISDFLHEDVDLQFINEQSAAVKLKKTFQTNLLFFKHFNNDIYQQVINYKAKNYAVFCTKDLALNIVETASGRVLYQADPKAEALMEVERFCQVAPTLYLDNNTAKTNLQPIAEKAVVLMFGIGAGLQLVPFLQKARPAVLVIYEAELDLFISSLSIINWADVFDTAASYNTMLSLQIGNNGASIAADLRELTELLPHLQHCHIYRHLAHPVSDEVLRFLLNHNGDRVKLLQHQRQFIGYSEDTLFVPERTPSVLANQEYSDAVKSELFLANMAAFQQYYPQLYDIFRDYKAQYWRCVEDENGFNLYCDERWALFYHDAEQDSCNSLQRFLRHPINNELILIQGGQDKFKNYVHFQAVKKIQPILEQLHLKTVNELDSVENLIILGVGLGRHIELLLEQHSIKNLFIFEPNIDFFYASLFVTDWAALFNKAAATEQRFYFNIGGSGEEYFTDIMSQYYQTGAYGLANSLVFNSFLTPGMKLSLQKLQSQLKIIVAMGENFDHVRYGVAHTYHSFSQNHGLLLRQPYRESDIATLDLPVIIVGNGPSLDKSYQYIKEQRDNLIVISCGTALRSLYKLGITPDFHAEIEQNRATVGWISQVKDPKWLKSISLLSINGVHPETAALFKKVYLALKTGESSTSLFSTALEQHRLKPVELNYCYPTVSNLVLDLFTELGFKQIYLFGVDLGYVDPNNHHSKFSAYYRENDGSSLQQVSDFDYNLVIKGNFRDVVQTKPEFDFSRSIMELRIASAAKDRQFFNCSDGAFIKGAYPLLPENIIIKPVDYAVSTAIEEFFDNSFHNYDLSLIADEIKAKVLATDFSSITTQLCNMCSPVTDEQEAKQLLPKQWEYLWDHYFSEQRLGFYLLCGSAIYFLTVLARLIPAASKKEDPARFDAFNQVLAIWRDYLQQAEQQYKADPFSFCNVSVEHLFSDKSKTN